MQFRNFILTLLDRAIYGKKYMFCLYTKIITLNPKMQVKLHTFLFSVIQNQTLEVENYFPSL